MNILRIVSDPKTETQTNTAIISRVLARILIFFSQIVVIEMFRELFAKRGEKSSSTAKVA